MSYIIMEGGISNLYSIYRFAFGYYSNNYDALLHLSQGIYNIFDISFLSFKESSGDVYFTHNDIKPENLVYSFNSKNQLQIKLIDLGGVVISNDFFTEWKVNTEYYVTLCLNDARYTSPLYDLSTLAVSIIMAYFSITTYPSTLFNIDYNQIDYVVKNRAKLVNKIYSLLKTDDQVIVATNPIYKIKIVLSYQILELLNLWVAIKCYHKFINSKMQWLSRPENFIFSHENFKIIDTQTGEQVNLYGTNNELYQNLIIYIKTKMKLIETIVNNQNPICDILDISHLTVKNNFYTPLETANNKQSANDLLKYTEDSSIFSEIP